MTEIIVGGLCFVVAAAAFVVLFRGRIELAKIDAKHEGWKQGFADAQDIYKPALLKAYEETEAVYRSRDRLMQQAIGALQSGDSVQ